VDAGLVIFLTVVQKNLMLGFIASGHGKSGILCRLRVQQLTRHQGGAQLAALRALRQFQSQPFTLAGLPQAQVDEQGQAEQHGQRRDQADLDSILEHGPRVKKHNAVKLLKRLQCWRKF